VVVGGPLSNDDLCAGLLTRALDQATQPPQIQAVLRAELDLRPDVIRDGARAVDFGCGTGRHFLLIRDRVRLGVGLDHERSYLAEAHRRVTDSRRHFINADATAVPPCGRLRRRDSPHEHLGHDA
jgi:SAM-dependent methyltransferase